VTKDDEDEEQEQDASVATSDSPLVESPEPAFFDIACAEDEEGGDNGENEEPACADIACVEGEKDSEEEKPRKVLSEGQRLFLQLKELAPDDAELDLYYNGNTGWDIEGLRSDVFEIRKGNANADKVYFILLMCFFVTYDASVSGFVTCVRS